MQWFLLYQAVMSVIAFIFCGVDKRRAKKGRWRVPERTLLLLSAFGGAWGFWLGMIVFHHKTKHLQFMIPVPLFAVLWTAGTIALGWYGIL